MAWRDGRFQSGYIVAILMSADRLRELQSIREKLNG
jgi:hypothetical protein